MPVDVLERLERLEEEREAELFRLAKRAASDEGAVPLREAFERCELLHAEQLGTCADMR